MCVLRGHLLNVFSFHFIRVFTYFQRVVLNIDYTNMIMIENNVLHLNFIFET